ncbi:MULTISPECIES: hypothetical protein [unclassified Microcoleus]|uniref:hypothetical protein n=1 Tax=unclassified Microcoleus TaxID=2642155 RepID=UPI002FD52E0B
MSAFLAEFPNWITAFDLIVVQINLESNTTIRVEDYEDIATNFACFWHSFFSQDWGVQNPGINPSAKACVYGVGFPVKQLVTNR